MRRTGILGVLREHRPLNKASVLWSEIPCHLNVAGLFRVLIFTCDVCIHWSELTGNISYEAYVICVVVKSVGKWKQAL